MKLIFKLVYWLYQASAWARRWLARRFTRTGLALVSALAVLGIMAPDTDNNVAYQAFALLFCLLGLAWAFTLSFRAPCSARRVLPRFATAGQPFSYPVIVSNAGSRNQTGLALLENVAGTEPSFDEWLAVQSAEEARMRSFRFSSRGRATPFRAALAAEAQVPVVPARGETEARMKITPFRRGVLRLDGLILARPDPLGLCRAANRLALPQTVLVLPHRYPLPRIALPGTMKYHEGGVALAANVGQSDEFVSLRDYRRGDPPRHIHWRSWARTGKPVVKEFEDEFFVRHALALDTFTDHPHSELFEEAVSVAASFACTVLTQESLLDLLFVGPESYCLTAGRGLAYTEQMLEILASVRPSRARPFADFESLVLRHAARVSGCIVVLLAWDEPRREFVRKLCGLGVPLLVLVLVEAGEETELDPGPLRGQAHRFHVLEVGRIEEGLLQVT